MSSGVNVNIASLLVKRELGPGKPLLSSKTDNGLDLEKQFASWKEADFLRHCSADYASFQPAPRSTIALCYNCNGSLLASTHGDHTVKITSCYTETLERVLSGHRRTPWVVRFHPRRANLLASGSLDHEVRLWDASSGECIAKHTFGKPIASLAFHANSSVLAVACGHKLYMWEYAAVGATPVIVLKTRRSMRAVHFHPRGLPLVLTAEVQDPTATPDLAPTMTEPGFSGPLAGRPGDGSEPMFDSHPATLSDAACPVGTASPPIQPAQRVVTERWPFVPQDLPPSMVPVGWEVPFPAIGPRLSRAPPVSGEENAVDNTNGGETNFATQLAAANYANVWSILGEEQPPRVRLKLWRFDEGKSSAALDETCALRLNVPDAVLCSEMGVQFSPCGRFIAATVACRGPIAASTVDATAAAPTAGHSGDAMDWSPVRAPHAHLHPQGREQEQQQQEQQSPHLQPPTTYHHQVLRIGSSGNGSTYISPLPERVVFEVRIISIDCNTFGDAIKARRIRAAHCLTSVQFSPAGDHVLLAYGKKHSSLLRSLVADRGALVPLHTILEVFRLSDMELARVLPSAEDEINAACFHPVPGGGIAYGTKEGRLRIIVHDKTDAEDGLNANGSDEGALLRGGNPQRPNLHDLQALGLAFMQQHWLQQEAGSPGSS